MRALRRSGSLSILFLMLCSLASSTRRTDASTWRGFASPICSRMSSTAFASPFIAFCTSFTTILSLTVRFASFTSSNDFTLSMGVTLPDLMGMVRAISRASARLFLSCLFRALALPPFFPFFAASSPLENCVALPRLRFSRLFSRPVFGGVSCPSAGLCSSEVSEVVSASFGPPAGSCASCSVMLPPSAPSAR